MAGRCLVRLSLLVAVCLALPGVRGVRPGRRRRDHRHRQGSGRRRRARRDRHRHRTSPPTASASSCRAATASTPRRAWRRASTASTSSWPASSRCGATGIRLATGEKARIDFDLAVGDVQRAGHRDGRRADPARGDRQPRHRRRARAGRAAAAERPHLHHARRRSRPASRCRPTRSCRASTAAGRAPTNICSTASPCCSRSRARSRIFPVIDAIQEFKIESNSPPAEFGRFNGGVVNLTTKAGTNAFHGNGFEFLRNEALNARNFFQSTNPVKPDYRRNQFGGTLGGPLVKDHTFFFVDYQGQRQSIGRTVTSTVPTRAAAAGDLHRSDRRPRAGDLRSGDDGRLDADAVSGQHDSGRRAWIRSRCRCCSAIRCRPRPAPPTTISRTDERGRQPGSVGRRASITSSRPNRDQVFGRLTYFRDGFVPVTPLPDGSGVTTGTLGPQDTTAWAFASNYQHTFSRNLLNEAAHRRHAPHGRRAPRRSSPSAPAPR